MSAPVARGSIRRRLLISLLAAAAFLAVAVFFMVQSVARQVAQASQDNVLAASAVSILDSARFNAGDLNLDLPYSALSMLDSVSDERVFYAIRLGSEFLSGYPELPQASVDEFGEPAFLSAAFLDEDVRIASIRRAVSTDLGQSFLQVSVAQTLSGQKATLARISRSALAVGAAFFLLSVVLAALIARSTIRPLDRLTGAVSRRGLTDLRPVSAPLPSEMVPLVASLNSLMARLQTSLDRSEDLITEAAHRVRTPLAIVRTKAEILQRRAQKPETKAAVREMIHAIDDSSRTAGQLLDHAMVTLRLDQLTREEIDLAALISDVVDRLQPMSDLKDIRLEFERRDAALVSGDPILLQNALLNVADNAIKYSPPGSTVTFGLSKTDRAAEVTVTDTGPGFPAGEVAHLSDRFARGTNARDVVGSGLGLTIVKEVVEAHGGRMDIANKEGSGACVTLCFPLS